MTKGMAAMLVYTTKVCNYNSIVIVRQHGGYDVTSKLRIVFCARSRPTNKQGIQKKNITKKLVEFKRPGCTKSG